MVFIYYLLDHAFSNSKLLLPSTKRIVFSLLTPVEWISARTTIQSSSPPVN